MTTLELNKQYDVLISGAGPCGATLAIFLGKHGISTLLIDSEDQVLDIPRAVGMCDEGSRILNAAGVFTHQPVDFVDIAATYFTNKAAESVFHFEMDLLINNERMQRTFYQPQLEQSLRASLERFDCVTFSPSTELKHFTDADGKVTVELDQSGVARSVVCRYLVACDGASSVIRKSLGIGFGGKTYQQDWLIIDVGKNPVDSDEIFFSIDPARPGITLPLPLGRRRWEFVVKKDDDVADLCKEESLSKMLSPWGDFKQMELERKAIYSFHARVAQQYTAGNVFLAGDAAHITPPFAGQGMMAGLRDAHNLSWKLAGVIKGQLHGTVLNSYDRERIPHSKQIIVFAQIIGKFVLPQNWLGAAVRDAVIKMATWAGLYSKNTGAKMNKIPNHINGGLLRNFLIRKLKGTGVWFPQYRLASDGVTNACDAWMDESFHIVSWQHSGENSLSDRNAQRWSALGGKFLNIGKDDSQYLIDESGRYADYFKKYNTLVIRPDKFVVLCCQQDQLDKKLGGYLDRICPPI